MDDLYSINGFLNYSQSDDIYAILCEIKYNYGSDVAIEFCRAFFENFNCENFVRIYIPTYPQPSSVDNEEMVTLLDIILK